MGEKVIPKIWKTKLDTCKVVEYPVVYTCMHKLNTPRRVFFANILHTQYQTYKCTRARVLLETQFTMQLGILCVRD